MPKNLFCVEIYSLCFYLKLWNKQMVSFKLLFRDIKTTELYKHSSNETIKFKLLDTVFSIISDRSKFEQLYNQEKYLNFILNKEKRLREIITG